MQMVEKSTTSFLTTLVPFLVVHNSKMPFSKPSAIVSGLRERLVQQKAAHLPGWMVSAIADPRWSRPVISMVSLHFSVDLMEVKNFG
jgi:hypothetical protein